MKIAFRFLAIASLVLGSAAFSRAAVENYTIDPVQDRKSNV